MKILAAFLAIYLLGFVVVAAIGCIEKGGLMSPTAFVGAFFAWWFLVVLKICGTSSHASGWNRV